MSAGRRLGSRYELDELLGRGGMGEVYRGRSTDDGSPVAIKLLRPEYASDRRLVARFIQERDILVALDHPNLVRVHDLVAEGHDLAIVMDLVDGGDLRQSLVAHGGTLAAGDAFVIGAQLFDALAAVHAAGIVHRDVKPENVLMPVGPQLIARLSDFGVARVTGDRGVSTTHTSLIGTPYYMAPELADGRPVTAAADIYAMGCTLYELISGTVPFAGSPLLVLRRHADEDPLPIPGLPDDAWQFIAALMAKEPTHRPTAAQAAEGARQFAQRYGTLAALPAMSAPNPRIRSTGGNPVRASWTGLTPSPADEPDDGPTVYAARSRTPEPDDGATVHRPFAATPPPTEPIPVVTVAPKDPWYRKAAVMIPAAVVVVLALIGGLVAALGGGEPPDDDGDTGIASTATTTTTSPPPPATYTTPPFQLPQGGSIATTKWTLGAADAGTLRGELKVKNATLAPASGTIVEVLPKSMVASAKDVTFTPAPAAIRENGPTGHTEAEFAFTNLPAGAEQTFAYTVKLSGGSGSADARLGDWAKAHADGLRTIYGTGGPKLLTLAFTPATVGVEVRKTATVAVSGKLDNGVDANAIYLSAVNYSSSNEAVARVAKDGTGTALTITAVRVGTAIITASSGDVAATIPVTVGPSGDPPPPPPDTPTTSTSTTTSTTSTSTSTTSTTSTTTTTTTAPPPPPPPPPACTAATYGARFAPAYNRAGLPSTDINFLQVINDNPGSFYGGYYGKWGANGSGLTFPSVSGGGSCRLQFRYRTNGFAQRALSVNGQFLRMVSFPANTSSFSANIWSYASVTVDVPAGASVTLHNSGADGDANNYLDLDELRVVAP